MAPVNSHHHDHIAQLYYTLSLKHKTAHLQLIGKGVREVCQAAQHAPVGPVLYHLATCASVHRLRMCVGSSAVDSLESYVQLRLLFSISPRGLRVLFSTTLSAGPVVQAPQQVWEVSLQMRALAAAICSTARSLKEQFYTCCMLSPKWSTMPATMSPRWMV
jgi:hypothetical protein